MPKKAKRTPGVRRGSRKVGKGTDGSGNFLERGRQIRIKTIQWYRGTEGPRNAASC